MEYELKNFKIFKEKLQSKSAFYGRIEYVFINIFVIIRGAIRSEKFKKFTAIKREF